MYEFQTNKTDLSKCRLVETTKPEISQDQALLKVDKFAFTANNITYAAMGDALRYWQFFPPSGDNPQDWGIIPVWGFADVVQSNSSELPVGDRLFGYFPPTNYLAITPSKVSAGALMDGSEHRRSLPPGYNLYRRVLAEANYQPQADDERMLLFVLHLTSFCLYDMLQSNDWFGAQQVVIISASSKTSTGLAYGLQADESAPAVVGLTSARNLALVDSLSVYQSAYSYDDIEKIDASLATVIVDMSGDSSVLGRLHTHLGDNMRFCSNVGFTHWNEPRSGEGIIQERSEMFFAPSVIQTRMKEWGREEFDKRSMQFVMHSAARSRSWLKMTYLEGVTGLQEVYADVCDGKIAADQGLIVKMYNSLEL
ncbi:MAG: hypothetical protein ACI9FR_002928 [Cryomorphaceae bacterium]